MKTPRFIVVTLVTLLLVAMAGIAIAQERQSPLEKSPISTGVLMSRAVRAGRVQLHGNGSGLAGALPPLTCSPTPCVLPNENVSQSSVLANETPVVVNPRNPQQILTGANDYGCPNIQGFYASSDGGSTWTRTCLSSVPGDFGEGDPGVGYDLHGTAFISGIDASSGIVFETSHNNGATWSTPAVAVAPFFSGGLADKPWLQIDTYPASPRVNSLYISVTQFDSSSNSEITVAHSSNGGASWTNVAVDSKQIFPAVDQFSDITTGKDGTVYVTWIRCTANGPTGDCGGTTASLMLSKSTDGGSTWSAATAMFTANLAPDTAGCCFYGALPNTDERVSEIPVIAADNSNGVHAGNLYVAYYNWTGNFMQVRVATSTNGGSTWSSKAVAPSTATHDQFFPWVNVNHAGLVGVSWMDRRNDAANVNYEAFGSFSPNGGASFTTNQDLSAAPSNPFNDGFGGFFIGDYTGNAWSGNRTFYVVYTDTTTGIDQEFLAGYQR